MTRVPLILRLAVVLLVQAAAIVWMVWDRAQILAHGTEIRLATAPVDPRDLFRGHYVRLAYDISRIRLPLVAGDDTFERNDPVHVVLKKGNEGTWQLVSVHRDRPDAKPPLVVLLGRVEYASENFSFPAPLPGEEPVQRPSCPKPCPGILVRYGIESYFVAKDKALALEDTRRTGAVEILVAVAPDGTGAIKGIVVDGALAYEEPLF